MSLVRNVCAAAAAVLLLGGCADSDDALSGGKAELAAQADPICVETRAKVGDLGGDPAAERDAVQSAADRLKAIPVPGEDEEKYKVFTVEVENLAISFEDVFQNRLRNATAEANTALGRAREANERVKKAAADYGLVECSQGLAT